MSLIWQEHSAVNPTERAYVVLEVCDGDLDEAREICVLNMLCNPAKEDYWRDVLRTLCMSGHA